MNITTDSRRVRCHGRPPLRRILCISVLVQLALVVLFWCCEPLRRTIISFDAEQARKHHEQLDARNRRRVKEEHERRQKTVIRKDDAETLKREARKKEEAKARRKLTEMREMQQHVAGEKLRALETLKDRSLADLNKPVASDLLTLVDAIMVNAVALRNRTRQPVGGAAFGRCQALKAQTIDFVTAPTAVGHAALQQQTVGLFALLQPALAQAAEFREAHGTEQAATRFGLLIHDASGVLHKLEQFQSKLLAYSFDTADLDPFNEIPEHSPSSLPPADPMNALSLAEMADRAAALDAQITDDFNQLRAAQIARIEQRSFQDALAGVNEAQAAAGQNPPPTPNTLPSPGNTQSENDQRSADGASPHTTVGELNRYRQGLGALGQLVTARWMAARSMVLQASPRSAANTADAFRTQPPKGGKQGSGRSKYSASDSGTATGFQNSRIQARTRSNGLRLRVPLEDIKARALPGRRFHQQSQRRGWLFIDTWYVIGPWENHGKLDYTHKHPPEIHVDLDREYVDGKVKNRASGERYPLRWQFIQSDIMRITPPQEVNHATYYAFTEVHCETAMDMYIAVGTDDAARLWLNDKLVWEDHGLSGWHLGEGFRLVQFAQGFNTLLLRIENSPSLCEYSVLLCPPSQMTGR